ncbi:iron complex transport system substrate-binding protein [Georgenia satyanarayanai]|uniref:Iron complex transport system substrate-binding protein n=1 Tax=Georgenia satyanarayanai TaxID=860221 RepID=A0A2Y9A3Y3_9MICO|nr:ABC transporter substrate-binding protein [Georgenia satyanarayanai]PYG00982.1 iron complex transport system substrate-binding protein [Georgenia satyanarayanai]SSA39221.1 iron complex transport system substrate-binding protein [Georgenia satyanarayanai]
MTRLPARLALAVAATALALTACGAQPTGETPVAEVTAPAVSEAPAGEPVVACGDPVEGFAVTHDHDGEPLPERTGSGDADLLTAPTSAVVADDTIDPVTTGVPPQLPVTVESCDGAVVEVTDTSRVLALDLYGTLAEIVFSLGLGDSVVGRDTSTGFPEAADLPVVTPGAHDLNAEAILALDPSVVLTDRTIGPTDVQLQLRDAGIPVIFFDDTRSMDTIPTHIRAVAGALGVPDAGEELVERTQQEITAALDDAPTGARSPAVAFLYLRGGMVQLLGGPGSGADSLIRAIGARDVGTEAGLERPFTQISAETMIGVQPDVLLLMSAGLESVGGAEGLTLVPGLAQTEAVADGRVVDMDDTVLLSFGPRTGRVVTALAEAVYE